MDFNCTAVDLVCCFRDPRIKNLHYAVYTAYLSFDYQCSLHHIADLLML